MSRNAISSTENSDMPAARTESAINRDGYIFVPGPEMRAQLGDGALSDWAQFKASWNDLELDTYMADRGRYRRRRYAVYEAATTGPVRRKPHEPHYQAPDYNPLNGGIERWFAPIEPEIGAGASLTAILHFCRDLFGRLAPATRAWHVEVHQFRIEAHAECKGFPTPEGMHRDGVDYVLVLLTERCNIKSGTTMISSAEGKPLGSFTLTEPFDSALVEDARVMHGVTPVEPIDPTQPAWRDVLVVTFRGQRLEARG